MKAILSFLAILGIFCGPLSAVERKPNVIVFLVDDMGWMDCGAYGSKYYETPRIDAFAQQAMRFTNAYAQPLCSPTRCSLNGFRREQPIRLRRKARRSISPPAIGVK